MLFEKMLEQIEELENVKEEPDEVPPLPTPTPDQEGGNDTITFPEYLEIETEQEGGENEYFPSDSESDEELFHFGGGKYRGREAKRESDRQAAIFESEYIDVAKLTGRILPRSIKRDVFEGDIDLSSRSEDEILYIRVSKNNTRNAVAQRANQGNFYGVERHRITMSSLNNHLIRSIVWARNENDQQILQIKNNYEDESLDFRVIYLKLNKIKVYRGDLLKELSEKFTALKNLTYIDNGMKVIQTDEPQENTSNIPSNTTTAPGPVPVNNSQVEQTQVSSNMGPNTTASGPVPVNNSQVEQTQVSSNMGPNTTASVPVIIPVNNSLKL